MLCLRFIYPTERKSGCFQSSCIVSTPWGNILGLFPHVLHCFLGKKSLEVESPSLAFALSVRVLSQITKKPPPNPHSPSNLGKHPFPTPSPMLGGVSHLNPSLPISNKAYPCSAVSPPPPKHLDRTDQTEPGILGTTRGASLPGFSVPRQKMKRPPPREGCL